ncbi:FtsK/SpoIIIE domain-containing protein [Streptomyces sp. NPDC005336]|uniref:FtsK/SpoIIIE domain-containing protein n=1 Tax=Streptomyces sp. NPDC005336 TaxID=3157035 RepID=UPI0033BE1CAB
MRLTLSVVDPLGGASTDVVLDADPESQMGDVARELAQYVEYGSGSSRSTTDSGAQIIPLQGQRGRPGGDTPPVYVDGYALDPSLTIAASPLRDGAIVSLRDPTGCLPGEPVGVVELRVASGPTAGSVHRLGVGRYDIGRGAAMYVRIDDPELPERAMTLSVASDGSCRVVVHADNSGTTLDGKALSDLENDDWPFGAQLAVGNSLLELVRYSPPNAALKWSEDGAALDYNRPPRLRPPDRVTKFRLPSPPREQQARPMPWLMALMPLVTAIVMVLVFNRWYYMIMALMSPVMMLANHFMDKKHGRKSHARELKEYKEHKARIERDAQDALVAERLERRHQLPDPATVLTLGTGPRTRLWERRRTDQDHLVLRVGTGRLPSEVVLDDPEQDDHRREITWEIEDAPVSLPLRTLGVVGVAGLGDAARALGRWAVAQTAVLHSPMDVQIFVLTESNAQDSWDWVRWLPHARPASGHDTNVLIGTDAETVGARIGELIQLLDARQKAAQQNQSQGASFSDPDIVVVWDGSRRLRSLPGVVKLLREGPAVSMFAICLDTEERFLPSECQAVVIAEPRPNEHDGSDLTHTPFEATPSGQAPSLFTPPTTTPVSAGAASPSIQAWHTTSTTTAHQSDQATVSPKLRLRVEQTGIARIQNVRPDFVSGAWCLRLSRALSPLRDISGETEDSALPSSSRLLDVIEMDPPTSGAVAARWHMGGQSTMAVIGESYDGPFRIDIRRDGPHGLIAGTTGSGKSELLQTIVAALAVANTPENMTFVLVDYKGGSAFKDCVQLPHTVGMVTDLDAHLVERALESLGAELKRREHILADVGAKDIEDYQDLARRDPSHKPLPRLLIVIDEFASMVRDLPDFVTGLVNIAQRGRSLGIHLLLATQRPSGVVSPEIRANTNLRIALRVTDGGESSDVIDAPDAGHISKNTPGRAYVRLGHASLIPFQSGRVGGRRPGVADPQTVAPWAGRLDWQDLGRAAMKKPAAAKREEEEITDLKVLVDAVREANEHLAIPPQHSPWLPALDTTLLLDDIPAIHGAGSLPPAPYGIEDLPAEQARRPVAIDFATFGHLLIGGAPRSGRSQVLRTIAGSLARTHSVANVHLYGIDCGNGALNALTRLPHCGAVVGRAQTERAQRLVNRLSAELTRRQELLAVDGFADIGEQRSAVTEERRLPHIVVFLDRWEGWLPTLGELGSGELTDEVYTIMREGASVGIHMIITGDRQLFVGRISSLTEDRYALRLADRSDFSMIGINYRKVPEEIAPGRAFKGETATETQFALLSDDNSGQGQAAALTAIGEAATGHNAALPRERRPFRVDVLPSRISFRDAWELRDSAASRSPLWSLVGVGGDELTGYGPDLASGIPAFVIGGPAKSGRSTVLLTMARSYLAQGVRLVIAAPRPSPLRELENEGGVLKVFTEDEIEDDEFTEAISSASVEAPVVVLIDDGEGLEDCDASSEFKKIIQRGTEHGLGLVLAGDEEEICGGFSGWQVEAKKARRGILLSPQDSSAGDLIGLRISRRAVGDPITPGKGLLHLGDGEPFSVTIPM